jgi:hypothetical protein
MLPMQISVKDTIVAGTGAFAARFARQVPFAAARALTQSAVTGRKDVQQELPRVFDRPTPFVVNGIRYEMAQKAAVRDGAVQARVYISDDASKGVSPRQVLAAQLAGGGRALKRFELAFVRLGLLTGGEVMVPAKGRTDLLDQYGNVRAALLVQLLSYFQAFGEQGYRANATQQRRDKIARYGRSASGFKSIGGKVYFWSRGPGRWSGRGSWANGRSQHLARGIWEKSGTHGVDVKPVLLAVRGARYAQRFDFVGIVERSVQRTFPSNFEASWRDAMLTAR